MKLNPHYMIVDAFRKVAMQRR